MVYPNAQVRNILVYFLYILQLHIEELVAQPCRVQAQLLDLYVQVWL